MSTLPTPPPLVRLADTLSSAAIRHDQACHKRSLRNPRSYWNPYALPQYLDRVREVVADVERGAEVRSAIVAGFTGRLQQVMLRSAGLGNPTEDEARGIVQQWYYVPASGAVEEGGDK